MLNSNSNANFATSFLVLPKALPMDFNAEFSQFLATLHYQLPNSGLQTLNLNHSTVFKTIDIAGNESNYMECDSIQNFLSSNSLFLEPDFKLIVKLKPDLPIFKGKYFSFKVYLKQNKGFDFPASEIVELETSVNTSENLLITKNMKGQDILKGNYIQNMSYYKPEKRHVAYIKIQITEVSSHYIGKSLNLKVRTRHSDFLQATGWKIQSSLISGISVKAKKRSEPSLP